MILRKKLIAGNWKMNKTPAEALALAQEIAVAVIDPCPRIGRRDQLAQDRRHPLRVDGEFQRLGILGAVALAGLQEERIAGTADGRRVDAQHRAQLQRADAELPRCHEHPPVQAAELIRTARPGLMVQLQKVGESKEELHRAYVSCVIESVCDPDSGKLVWNDRDREVLFAQPCGSWIDAVAKKEAR